MAFASAPGYTNLPNGNFSPTLYSKKAQLAFRKTSVVQAVTNTDYYGEISEFGDTVRIIKEPDITVNAYQRGTTVTAQDLQDDDITLTVDQANYFAFRVDDIEKSQSHVNWEALASSRAGYKMRDAMDSEVLTHMTAQVPTAQLEGDASTPATIGHGTQDFSPIQMINRFGRFLDMNDVPEEGRWLVCDPVFLELLRDENSKLLDSDYAQEESNILRNGMVTRRPVYGFTLYKSRNLPVEGSGAMASGSGNGNWLLAGHMSSTATAEQINKTESYRDPDTFADVVRGLHLYGRSVLRTEALVGSVWNNG
jgi:hypothetical protein